MKTKNKTPEFCETLRQAESRWHIPRSELSRAKSAGCLAFRGGRVYRDEVVGWLKENPRPAGEGKDESLRARKMEMQIQKLSVEIDVARGKLVERETVKTFFGEVVSDLFSILDRHLSREVFNLVSRELKNAIGNRGELKTL